MAWTLEEFCAKSSATLKSGDALDRKLAQIAEFLAALLANPEFVAQAFSEDDPPGHRTLFHCPATDYHVLAHVQRPGKSGRPHSHGASSLGPAKLGLRHRIAPAPCRRETAGKWPR